MRSSSLDSCFETRTLENAPKIGSGLFLDSRKLSESDVLTAGGKISSTFRWGWATTRLDSLAMNLHARVYSHIGSLWLGISLGGWQVQVPENVWRDISDLLSPSRKSSGKYLDFSACLKLLKVTVCNYLLQWLSFSVCQTHRIKVGFRNKPGNSWLFLKAVEDQLPEEVVRKDQ